MKGKFIIKTKKEGLKQLFKLKKDYFETFVHLNR